MLIIADPTKIKAPVVDLTPTLAPETLVQPNEPDPEPEPAVPAVPLIKPLGLQTPFLSAPAPAVPAPKAEVKSAEAPASNVPVEDDDSEDDSDSSDDDDYHGNRRRQTADTKAIKLGPGLYDPKVALCFISLGLLCRRRRRRSDRSSCARLGAP